MKLRIVVLGNDLRQEYLKQLLAASGASLVSFQDSFDVLILPIPTKESLLAESFSHLFKEHIVIGGPISNEYRIKFMNHGITYINIMAQNSVASKNAIATAEGVIAEAIQKSPVTLAQKNCLVIGYGNCGEVLCDRLCGLQCRVFVSDIDSKKQLEALSSGYYLQSLGKENKDALASFSYLFNTAPDTVLTSEIIDCLSKDVLILDIASSPGGTDFNYCKEKRIAAYLCPGLPAKYSPLTSAKIMFEEMTSILEHLR